MDFILKVKNPNSFLFGIRKKKAYKYPHSSRGRHESKFVI